MSVKKNSLSKIAISLGDPNGIGPIIALHAHNTIKKICTPIYCINKTLLEQIAKLANQKIPKDFKLFETPGNFTIKPGLITKNAGQFSFDSFDDAIRLATSKKADAIVTLPINKQSWQKANIGFKGHTDFLRNYFAQDAIMMLGCNSLFVGLFTEHVALKDVPKNIATKKIFKFLCDFYRTTKQNKICVLGLNPHAGDNGVLGKEEKKIAKAILEVNAFFQKKIFFGPVVPDIAFTPKMRQEFQYFVAMYHDQGLAPLKALYFEESINVSLNLPIIRTSVDHGTAFDIAYTQNKPNTTSYINAMKKAVLLCQNKA